MAIFGDVAQWIFGGAVKYIPLSWLSNDTTMAADSATLVPTQHAVKTYVDSLVSSALEYKGAINCSANPNYPAANAGDLYYVSAAGKIGGASGATVAVGDLLICSVNGSPAGTQAAVGANWNIIPATAFLGTMSAQDADDVAITGGTITGVTYNGLTVSTTTGTLTIANGKTLTASNTITLTGTDGSTLNIGTGGTLDGMAFQNSGAVSITGGSINGTSIGTAIGQQAAGGFSTLFTTDIATFQSGQVVAERIITGAGSVTVTTADYFVVIKKTVGSATAVSIPGAPTTGTVFIIKDGKGDAATNNITITPTTGTIDGAANKVLNVNYQSISLIFNGNEWETVTPTGTMAYQNANAVAITGGTITGATVSGLTVTTSTGTLTVANGKTLTASNSITIAGTDGSTLNVGAGGTLGTAAYQSVGAFLQVSNNLSDLGSASTARTNLGLGSIATQAANNVAITGGAITGTSVTLRVTSIADATTLTPNSATTDIAEQINTQSAGTLTIGAPSGSPVDGQMLTIKLKSTNVQTFSFNAIYRGSTTTPLPTTSSGSSKIDYMLFMYDTNGSKWDYIAENFGH